MDHVSLRLIEGGMIVNDAFRITFNSSAVVAFAAKLAKRALSVMAFRVRKSAIDSIETSGEPSPAGSAPHTRRGQLRQAIAYSVDAPAKQAIVGPMFSVVGEAGAAHEFGGMFRGVNYDERPFMGPALDDNANDFARFFQDSSNN